MAEDKDDAKEPETGTDAAEVDWEAKYREERKYARMWEERAKTNKSAADELEKLKESEKSELEKAQDEARKAQAALDALKKSAETDKLKAKVASETGVPAEFIVGDDEEDMREYAKKLAEHFKPATAPKVGGAGKVPRERGAADINDAKRELAREMFGTR
jgi:alanyl-tRNA synthetase